MMFFDFLGEGLFRELAEKFGDLVYDGGLVSIGDLEAAVRQDPGNAICHRDYGRRMLQDAKPARALQAFTRALELDAGDILARLGLACALDAKGLTQTAIEELQHCLESRPDYPPVTVALEYCTQKLGDPPAAAENRVESGEVVTVS